MMRERAFMTPQYNPLYEEPAYGVPEAAAYLKVPYQTLRYWLTGFNARPPVVEPIEKNPIRLSFLNLLECQVLAGMRKIYKVKLPRVRSALIQVAEDYPQPHPLVSQVFLTDRKNLFIEKVGKIINVSEHGQMDLSFYEMHLERIKMDPDGMLKFFPFVVHPGSGEPKSVEINPMIGFGKPVIAGTGISTAIIASRFNARDSIADLAAEYDCSPQQIEEAIRWELPLPVAA
jgi:uncharacterized protein (DUF433 family)